MRFSIKASQGLPKVLEKLVNQEPKARDLQAFRVFFQHPNWVLTLVNP